MSVLLVGELPRVFTGVAKRGVWLGAPRMHEFIPAYPPAIPIREKHRKGDWQ